MMTEDEFQDLAKTENWIALGAWLNRVVQDSQAFGFAFPDDALQSVAAIRGTKPASLRNPMSAAKWLEQNRPDLFESKPDWLAMMQVILLSRIDRYDPKKSKEIADAVLSGELSQADTKSILDEVRLAEKPAVVIARGGFGGQRRARDFEVNAKMLFKQNTSDIFNVENLTVREGRTFEPLATDLIVYKGSEPFAAIEIKGPRNRIDPGYLIDQLARAALLLRKVPQVLYVVPEQSEYKLGELVAIRDKLEIEGIKFGTLPEKSRLAPKDLKVLG